MNDLYKFLDQLGKGRPALYIGKASIHTLGLIILGYSWAIDEHNIDPHESWKDFEGFDKWVKLKFSSTYTSTQMWPEIINQENGQDEFKALSHFLVLAKEYENRINKKI